MNEAERLSKLLWSVREDLSMLVDIIELRTGKTAKDTRKRLQEIDDYRREKGWSPCGFGREYPVAWTADDERFIDNVRQRLEKPGPGLYGDDTVQRLFDLLQRKVQV